MGSPGELRRDFTPTERPSWRRSDVATSDMADKIADYCARYEQLSQDEASWARAVYAERAYGEYLFQVNKIEHEGFSSYSETQEAISKGALQLAESSDYTAQDDIRLEHVCCLYRALRHWFKREDEPRPSLSIQEVEKSHRILLGSTKQDIAGRIRCLEHEVVFVNAEEEDDGIHVFMWPTEVRPALQQLLEKTELAVSQLMSQKDDPKSRIAGLLKLGGAFFLEFENIHPFMDGNGRCGRILLAYILQSVMPFPNVLFVDRPADYGLPPFITPVYYYDCFQDAQSKQQFAIQDGHPVITKESAVCKLHYPRDLTALIIEGVYVGWKRFFKQLEAECSPKRKRASDEEEPLDKAQKIDDEEHALALHVYAKRIYSLQYTSPLYPSL